MDMNYKGQSLCFNREEFTEKDFSVDKFVSDYRKFTSLDVIQEDLNILYKKLCTAMVELINQDYADFVNLSTNLVGLDKSIKKLTNPLENLRSEVEQIHEKLLTSVSTVIDISSEEGDVYLSKVWIQHMYFAFEGLTKIEELRRHADKKEDYIELCPLETLERIAVESKIVEFHVFKLKNFPQPKFALPEVWFTCCQTVQKLMENLGKELELVFLRSMKYSKNSYLEKILQIYTFISAEKVLEQCFRIRIVQPFMKYVITESRIAKEGLTNVYADILNFLPKYRAILKISRNAKDEDISKPRVDFLVDAVWSEVMSRFECLSPVLIFSIGDPHLFHKNYSATMDFLEKFEGNCLSKNSVSYLRNDSSYKDFMAKWNLTVYFEIRFQEIASMLEEKLSLPYAKSDGNSHFMLDTSQCLYTCLQCCWRDDIFLPCLKSSFTKLFLQLLSRFNKFIQSHLKMKENPIFIAMLINDVELLVTDVKSLFKDTMLPKFSHSERDCVCAAFDDSIAILGKNPEMAADLIVKQLSEKCSSHLKWIASLPQRYRKTNREVPSKASPYVSQVLEPLSEFMLESQFLSLKWRKYYQVEVIDDILKRCVASMRDVLQSIKKMEDSLKILKRAKATSGQFSSGVLSDDDKIRRQLALDVSCFEELISSSGLETSDLKTLKELKELVKSAERIN